MWGLSAACLPTTRRRACPTRRPTSSATVRRALHKAGSTRVRARGPTRAAISTLDAPRRRQDVSRTAGPSRACTALPCSRLARAREDARACARGRLLLAVAQVNHTYGYYEADYAIANEHGVSFGESTCSAKTFALPVSQGGPSLLSMYELTRLAAERETTARGA
eukprot:2443683-Prymnesium_polylepis.1